MYETPPLFQHQENGRTWVYEDNRLLNFLHRKVSEVEKQRLGNDEWLHIQTVNRNSFDFVVRNNMGCGSAIGPILASGIGIRTIDCGIPQLSMHNLRSNGLRRQPVTLAKDRKVLKDSGMDTRKELFKARLLVNQG
ncbi:probable aspartyl aminopeptidase isoform X1 [Tanacetum coccineum]